MVALLKMSLTSKLMGLGTFASCLLFYYLLLDVDYPLRQPPVFDTLPTFPSSSYVEVVAENETSPLFGTMWPYRVFKSSPFNPPNFDYYDNGQELADGYIIFTPQLRVDDGQKQSAPMIMDQQNELVYCLDLPGNGHNLRVQTIYGKPHLTLWNGVTIKDHGYGNLVILDHEYRQTVVKLNATMDVGGVFEAPGTMDFREQEVTERDSVLLVAYNAVPYDLTPLGGPVDGWVADSLLYEVDIKTGEILFRWSAMEHFKVEDSRIPLPNYQGDGTIERPYDYFHLNSMQVFTNDTYLICGRHFWSNYLISRTTGEVLWDLNGSGETLVGDFGRLPTAAQFRWQHHVRAHNITENGFRLSMFDNHNDEDDTDITSSRALLFDVALPPNSSIPPVLVHDLESVEDIFSQSQGGYEIGLSNGNQLVSYGPIPVIREYGPTGDSSDLRWEGRFGFNNKAQSYRAYKQEWHATPKGWVPSLVLERDEDHQLHAYVSWNGATDIEAWKLFNVDRGTRMTAIGRAKKRGFETLIDVPSQFNGTQCLQAAAIRNGQEVAHSNMACIFINI